MPNFSALLAAALLSVPASLAAQSAAVPPAASVTRDSAVITQHARVHLALNALRDREHAELAAPKNKKVEAQAELRDRFRALRTDLFVREKYTAAQYADMTQRISGDDALRALFEATLERLQKK
ncbi:hypothetical protein [Gemmatimonas sp.]|uniref:hypothetical protein n=1 Tax=Gemmatimonas sp. TaxID=1962908 RepID=UPI00334249B8